MTAPIANQEFSGTSSSRPGPHLARLDVRQPRDRHRERDGDRDERERQCEQQRDESELGGRRLAERRVEALEHREYEHDEARERRQRRERVRRADKPQARHGQRERGGRQPADQEVSTRQARGRALDGLREQLLLGLVGALALVCVPAASAKAALISTDPCDNAALTQPFAPWGDSNSYELVPGGDFQGSLAGWTLTGGASRDPGSEPFGATGNVGKSSIYLPAGGSVQSPYTCVDAAYPAFRFFGRNNGLLSTVAVSIAYKEPLLGPVAVPIGTVLLTPGWAPSARMLTLSAVQGIVNGLLTGTTPQVALRFTAVTGSSQIDDVFIDPHMSKG